MFQKGDFMFAFDLKSGYHHVDIYQPHREFLGFQWAVGDKQTFYLFNVLPFGLSTACYTFTKLLRPLIKYWRGKGLRALLHLDDGIVAVAGEDAAKLASQQVRDDLAKAGLVEHSDKCTWSPTLSLKWLGFNLDLEKGQISVPEDKLCALKTQLQVAANSTQIKAKSLASITGKLISMSIAMGPVTRLMTRSMYALLNTQQFWCQYLPITNLVQEEISFWVQQLDTFNGQGIWHTPSAVRIVYADASSTGYGGYTVEHGCYIAHGPWTAEEAARSSTWRELRAVRMVLESLAPKLKNERIRWFSDNQNVVRILQTGSRKPDLQTEALAIFSTALGGQIRIEPEWIPRTQNEEADALSRIIDYDDWGVDPLLFARLDSLWGPHSIDRFASFYNTKLPRFNSRYWNPGSEAVDAFTCDWSNECNWLCPPPYLLPRTIKYVIQTGAIGTLIVPRWLSAPFWPMLFPDGHHPAPFISEVVVIDKSECLLIPGRSGNNLFKGIPNTDLLAIRLGARH